MSKPISIRQMLIEDNLGTAPYRNKWYDAQFPSCRKITATCVMNFLWLQLTLDSDITMHFSFTVGHMIDIPAKGTGDSNDLPVSGEFFPPYLLFEHC